MAPQSYQLVMRTGPSPGKSYELRDEEITIGRDISNDIVVSDPEVSRQHARLTAQNQGYVLEDRGSTNGTFVNGQRLMGPHYMRSGEVVLLGENVSFLYEQMDYDPDATMVAGSHVPSMPPASPPQTRQAERPIYGEPEREAPRRPEPQRPPPQHPEYPYVPPGEEEFYTGLEEDEERARSRTWVLAGCGCLVILACVLVLGAVAFDQLNMYCSPPFEQFFACP